MRLLSEAIHHDESAMRLRLRMIEAIHHDEPATRCSAV
jgi:hypothetical protein